MIVKGVCAEREEKRQVVEGVKKKVVGIGAVAVEDPARDPSSPISDSSCQTTVAKPVPGRTSGPARRSTKGGWTEEEDEVLARVVKEFKGKNWKKIAEFFPGRSDVQCLHRWQKVLDPELIKGAWTKEEDEHIIDLVNKYGPKKWAIIASKMPGRIGKQCRERWHNHLNPAIKKGAWTTEEEITLIRAHQIYGNKWAEIAKFLPGRADNSIKNHWNCSVKKKLDSYLSSQLLAQPLKIAALDLNSDPTDMEHPKDLATPKVGMIIDQKPMTPIVVHTSPILHHGSSRMPKEDSGGCKTVAQPITMESLRHSNEVPTFIRPPTARDLNPIRRYSTSLSPRENSNYTNARHFATSFQCKGDDYHHSRASDNLVPTTPLQDKPCASISSESCLQMHSHGLNTKKLFASPERSCGLAQPGNSLAGTDGTKNLNVDGASPLQETILTDVDKAINCEQTPCTPVLVDKVNFDHDFDAPVQLSDLQERRTKVNLLESDNSMLEPDSPTSCSAPPKLSLGYSLNLKDPESILRNAAKSFRNIPSIMRKRRQNCLVPSPVKKPYRECADAENMCGACSPVAKVGSGADPVGPHLHQHEVQTYHDKCLNNALRVSQPFLSSSTPKSAQRDATESVEKRLEFAFDVEWNGANENHAIPLVCTPLSVAFDVNNLSGSREQLDRLGQGICHLIPEAIVTYD